MPALRPVLIVPVLLGPFSLDGFVVGGRREGIHSLGKVFDQVAEDAGDFEYARDAAVGIDHREPPESAGSHQADRFADGIVGSQGDGIADHDRSHRLIEIRPVGQQTQRIALGEDAQEFGVATDHRRTGRSLLEHPHDVPHGVFRSDTHRPGRMSLLDGFRLKMELKIHGH